MTRRERLHVGMPQSGDEEKGVRTATERLLNRGVREIPVIDGDGAIVGFLDEDELIKVHVSAATRADASARSTTEIPVTRES